MKAYPMRVALGWIGGIALSGCLGPERLDEGASQEAFSSTVVVLTDVQLQVYRAVEASELAKNLQVESDDGRIVFEGDLDGGWGWDGTLGVDGEVDFSGVALEGFDLTVDAESVDVDGLLLAGDLEWNADGGLTVNGTYVYTADVIGELEATGTATGAVSFDYTLALEIDFDAGTYTYAAKGAANGFDIETWNDLMEGSGTFLYTE